MKSFYFKKIFGMLTIVCVVSTILIPTFAHAQEEDPILRVEAKASGNFVQDCVTGPLVSLAGSVAGGFLSSIFGQVPVSDFQSHLKACLNTLLDTALRVARSVLKKRLLDQIVDQTVQWIQNPEGGKPRFITNFGGVLDDAVQAGLGDTIREVGLGEFCDAQVKARLQITLRQPQRFSQGVSCTLDDVVGNISAFKDNFKNGSWVGIQTAADPRNNPLGIKLLAMEQVLINTDKQEKAAQAEISGGGGFIGQKTCNSWVLVDPVSLLSIKDASGQEIRNFDLHPKDQPPTPPTGVPVGSYYYCDSVGEVIVTPADTVGAVASKTLVSDLDYILSSDDLEAYVAAIADAAINRLTNEAVSGLSGLFSGGGSPQRAGGSYTGVNDSRITNSNNTANNVNNPNTIAAQALVATVAQLNSALNTASTTLASINDTNANTIDFITSSDGLAQCMTQMPTFVPSPSTLNPATYLMAAQTRASTTIPTLQTQISQMISGLSSQSTESINSYVEEAQNTIISPVSMLKAEIEADYTTVMTNLAACESALFPNGGGNNGGPNTP